MLCRGKNISMHFLTQSLRFSLVTSRRLISRAMSTALQLPSYETLLLSQPADHVIQVELNRPEKHNAMNKAFWREMVECFNYLSTLSDCRSIVVSGSGKSFTSGLDIMDHADVFAGTEGKDIARKAFVFREFIKSYQLSFTSVEKCPKPVIAAIHGACVGGGVDLIASCDIRLCTRDAWFQVKEVDIGLAADVGTLQRLPRLVGNDSIVRELVYTSRKMPADEASRIGLVSALYESKPEMIAAAISLASVISSKSPVAVQGSKVNLNYSRGRSVDEGLEFMTAWNMSMLQTEDIMESVQAMMEKKDPVYSKL